jgi:type II secretory pathway component PulF
VAGSARPWGGIVLLLVLSILMPIINLSNLAGM